MQLARWKLGKKTHPNHGGCYCPTATMVPSLQHRHIQQLTNMLRNKSVIKTREYYCFYYVFGMVHANVGRKLLNCYPLRVFSGD